MPIDLTDRSVAVVLGTRPEIVKLAGIVKLLGPAATLINTGQHYEASLNEAFVVDMGLPRPAITFGVGGTTRGEQIAEATRLLDQAFADPRIAAVVVQGDTNTVLAGAVAANARGKLLIHVEAGLRSYDRAMPEEHNRVIADHLADLCLAPTEANKANLAAEGITGDRVVVTGNTIVEAIRDHLPDLGDRRATLGDLGLESGKYVLATFHRPENVDTKSTLVQVLEQLGALPLPVVLPLHPRTRNRVADFGIDGLLDPIHVIEPARQARFLSLIAESALVISDSGGIQEEVSVLKRPLVLVRNSTERPEVQGSFVELVQPGPNLGVVAGEWLADIDAVHARLAQLPSPYGDGTASARSVAALRELMGRRS